MVVHKKKKKKKTERKDKRTANSTTNKYGGREQKHDAQESRPVVCVFRITFAKLLHQSDERMVCKKLNESTLT